MARWDISGVIRCGSGKCRFVIVIYNTVEHEKLHTRVSPHGVLYYVVVLKFLEGHLGPLIVQSHAQSQLVCGIFSQWL